MSIADAALSASPIAGDSAPANQTPTKSPRKRSITAKADVVQQPEAR